jgi:hypothetical protein
MNSMQFITSRLQPDFPPVEIKDEGDILINQQ